MRTEHETSYIITAEVDADARCDFCKRDPATDVRLVRYSRNGFQGHNFNICGPCRLDLIHHLSAR